MYRKILVPLDGSEFAERVLPFAKALAKNGGTKVLLVHAVAAHTLPGVDPTDDQVRAVRDGEAYLASIAMRMAQQGVAIETAVPYGSPGEAILTEIRVRGPDLVLMTTHGRSGLGRWVYGSVAEEVLHSSPVPVLLVQSWQGEQSWRTLFERPRLLVPLDGSPFAEAALAPAAELAQQLGGDLVLMQAVSVMEQVVLAPGPGMIVPVAIAAERVRELEDEARAYLQEVARRVKSEMGLEPLVEVYAGEAADAIAAASLEHKATLVVMTTHGRTGLSQMVFGSVASGVLRRASTPLLLVRPTGEAARETRPPNTTTPIF